MTLHAEEEMNDDELSIFDVEEIILSGRIVARQKEQTTGDSKYLLQGESLKGEIATTVCKFSATNKLVMITVYLGI